MQTVLQESGRIDVLINNAGYGSYGPIESVSRRKLRGNLMLTYLVWLD